MDWEPDWIGITNFYKRVTINDFDDKDDYDNDNASDDNYSVEEEIDNQRD